MKHKFEIGRPEIVGFCVLGGTIGAVLAGATESSVSWQAMGGGVAGALLLPAAVLMPWRRVLARKWASRSEAVSG